MLEEKQKNKFSTKSEYFTYSILQWDIHSPKVLILMKGKFTPDRLF